VSETTDLYRETAEYHKQLRQQRLARNEATYDLSNWKQHTPYHWGRTVKGKKLDFWPTKDKWMYDGKVRVGGLYFWLTAQGENP